MYNTIQTFYQHKGIQWINVGTNDLLNTLDNSIKELNVSNTLSKSLDDIVKALKSS